MYIQNLFNLYRRCINYFYIPYTILIKKMIYGINDNII